MRKDYTFLILFLFVTNITVYCQTIFNEQKAGHIFYVSLPKYMNKTVGLNSSATIQFKNLIKDVAGFVIEDNKEELKLAEINYSSINEFYNDFIDDFLKDEDKRIISSPHFKIDNKINFIEVDVSYYDVESKIEIYYFVGIAETSSAYYKVLCWCTIDNKEKFKYDFQNILYSIKD